VEAGADFARDAVVRWRCVDLQRRIEPEFDASLHERSVGRLLHKLSFRKPSRRPLHPQSQPAEQASFKTGFPTA
jgi:transposase